MEIVYKAVSVTDGLPRCLRRIPSKHSCDATSLLRKHVTIIDNLDSRSLTNKQMIACDRWNAKNFMHPHVVPLREVFQTRAFGDNCEFVSTSVGCNRHV